MPIFLASAVARLAENIHKNEHVVALVCYVGVEQQKIIIVTLDN